jgi:hypothetical protein
VRLPRLRGARRGLGRLRAPLFAGLALAAACATPLEERAWLRVESPSLVAYGAGTPEELRSVAAQLERFRALSARLLRVQRPDDAPPLRVVLFPDPRSYRRAADRRGTTAGRFLHTPSGGILLIGDGGAGVALPEIVQHEYVHALLRHHARLPGWFEEGLAELLSTTAVEGDEVVIGRPPMRVAQLLAGMDAGVARFAPFSELIADDFDLLRRERDTDAYTQYWIAAHYWFLGGGDRAPLDRYILDWAAGAESNAAFEAAFGVPADAFWERELAPYLARRRVAVQRGRLDALDAAPELPVRPATRGEIDALFAELRAARRDG